MGCWKQHTRGEIRVFLSVIATDLGMSDMSLPPQHYQSDINESNQAGRWCLTYRGWYLNCLNDKQGTPLVYRCSQ